MEDEDISLYFNLQKNKCVCHIANTKNNNNFEIIKVIGNSETVYVCTSSKDFYPQSQKWYRVFSRGLNKLYDFFLYGFSLQGFSIHDEKLMQDILEKGSTCTKKLLFV